MMEFIYGLIPVIFREDLILSLEDMSFERRFYNIKLVKNCVIAINIISVIWRRDYLCQIREPAKAEAASALSDNGDPSKHCMETKEDYEITPEAVAALASLADTYNEISFSKL